MGRPREERAVGREAHTVIRSPDYCDGYMGRDSRRRIMKWSGNRRALCGRAEQWPVTILDANHLIGASGLTVVSYLDELKRMATARSICTVR